MAQFKDGDSRTINGVTYVRQGGTWLPQGSGAPNVVVPAAPAKPEFVPGHPDLVMDAQGNVHRLPTVPPSAPPAHFVPLQKTDPRYRPEYPSAQINTATGEVNYGPKAESDTDSADAKKASALEATRNLVQSIEKAKGLVSGYSTGFGGYLGQAVPASTEANKLDTVINQEIRGNIFKNWVDTMKAQTDTGTTGIGRIMQSEIPLVTGSLGALDPVKMGKQGTLDSLNQIEDRVLRSAVMLNGENPDDPKAIQKYRQQFLPAAGKGPTPPSVGPNDGGPPGSPPVAPHDFSPMVGGPSAGLATGSFRNEYDPVMANAVSTFIKHGTPYETVAAYAQSHGFNPPAPDQYGAAVEFAKAHRGATNVEANRLVPTTLGERLSASPLAAGLVGATSAATAGLADVAGRSLAGPQFDANRAALALTNPGSDLIGNVVGGAAGMFGGGSLAGSILRGGAKGGLGRNLLALATKNPVATGILGDTAYGGVYGASESPDDPVLGAGVGALGGLGGGAAGNLLAKGAGAALQGVTDPAVQRLRQAGIPLTAGEALGGGVKKAQDALTSVFGPGNMVARRYGEGREALNRLAFSQAGDTIGAPISAVGQRGVQALNAAKDRAYRDALDPISIDLSTPQAINDIGGAVQAARAIPNADNASTIAEGGLTNYIWNPAPGGMMSGRDFQQGYRGLARLANKTSDRVYGYEIGQALGQGKAALVNALEEQNPGAFAGFQRANAANRQLNIIADAVNAAKNQVDTGEPLFTPAQLGTAATNNAKKYGGNIAAASGTRPFNQLINDAQKVMSSRLNESGTAPREFVTRLATTGGIAGLGGMFGGRVGGDKGVIEGAALPLGVLTLLGTRRGQQLLTAALLNRTAADQFTGRMLSRTPQVGGDILTAAGVPLLAGP